MSRQVDSLFAPPLWHSSITMKSKKSGGYWPNHGDGFPSSAGPDMNVWKIVRKTLALVGTRPFLRNSSGRKRASAFSSKAAKLVKSLKACFARVFRSARKRIRGRLVGWYERFHLAWNSFQMIWKAIEVLPVPVARVNRMRSLRAATASNTRLTAMSW